MNCSLRNCIYGVLFFLICVPSFARQSTDASDFHPQASEKAMVVCGNARFTVLTSRLLRMEWSEDGVFEDRATLGIVNRDLDVPAFDVRKSGSKVIIKTSDLTLSYAGGGKFSAENLTVSFKMADPKAKKGVKTVTWRPGHDDSANLLGTCRTLDGCDGIRTLDPYDPGIISRDGWAIVDESQRHIFVPVEKDWKYWAECRPEGDRQDLYFFGYGHDYMAALGDFVKIAGRIPLPPKYTFGYWWCRYWEYSDLELLDLSDHFMAYNIPMDAMIIDMDWHETWNERSRTSPRRGKNGRVGLDEFGQRIGWTGYTWKKELFPDPANFLGELHRRGIKTSLNLHFNNGIQPYEEPYQRFVDEYTSLTDDYDGPRGYVYDAPYKFAGNDEAVGNAGEKAPVPYRMSQIEWADAYFKTVIRPFDQQGVDFWWLDWQQWKESRYVKDLSNTFWLNYTFFNDKVRQTESLGIEAPRAMIYHRWGGIGSHRYQVGFSGDVYATWQALGYLPYFTATASNVGYGYWGHDIGGHWQPKGGSKETDPELYTRWIQSGVFTPIFKTHSTKDTSMEKRFWVFPDHFDPMRAAIRLRYDLSPYVYTAARHAYDTGVSICRPLYYYWPEADEAYQWKEEYMFGSDILATTICQPADKVTGLAERAVWFPEGCEWYDVSTGCMYKGGSEHTLLYTINENPYYVKAGAVIPMAGEDISTLQEQNPELRLYVVPGLGDFSTSVYEDDGQSMAYADEFAVTEMTKSSVPGEVKLAVLPRKGTFKGICPDRKISVVLEGHHAPSSVMVNGTEIQYSRYAQYDRKQGKAVWGYDGYNMQVKIYLPESSADEKVEIVCTYSDPAKMYITGKKGIVKRISAMTAEAKLKFAELKIADFQIPSEFTSVAQCGSFINEDPYNAPGYLDAVDVESMISNINSWEKLSPDFKTKVSAQTVFEK